VKESLPSTQINNVNNALVKPSMSSPKRSTVISVGLIKIPCFEWKTEENIGEKTAEYYLNIYYYQLSNATNTNNTNLKSKKRESIMYTKDETLITNVEELPFIIKERSLSSAEEEQVIKLLKKLIIFQDVSQEILSIIASEMTLMVLPPEKTVYDLNDEGNFFYIIGKGKVAVNINENETNILTTWHTFGEISLFTEKKREEVITTKESTELFIIDGESFRDIQKRNNEMILKERYNFLNNIFLFECLDKISKYNVAQKMQKKEFSPNTKIINEGETGDKLYIIKEGIVSCRIGPKEIRRLSNNEYFGQNSILIDVKRGANIIALQKTVCYELSKYDLKEALTKDYIDVILFCFFKNAIDKNTNLKNIIIESHLHGVFNCFSIQQYGKKEHLYDPKNKKPIKSQSKKLVLIIEGSLFKEKTLIADRGKFLGEELFNDVNKGISEDIYANPDAITFEADIFDIAKIMKIDLIKDKEKPLNILRAINKLKKIYLFKTLSDKTLESIALGMKKQKFKPNEYIIEENTKGDLFYLIIKGRVRITVKGNFVRDLDSGDCLGENVLLTDNVLRTASAMALDKVLCYVLSNAEFQVILNDNNTREYLMKKLSLQDTEINLSSLNYIKFLGKGKFGSVSLVHNNKNIYAIKAISRKSVEKEKILAKYFVNERKIMLSLDHPFIVKMVKSMKNQNFCFLLIEFINGINLDQYLSNRETRQNIYETQFYIGSILLMLDYIQKKFIAHRDIKPSNIMIDYNGYLKMIDFGTAKILTDYTSTIIGTPHYIAPEILQGRGYSLSCDFWSLGICMYEIFYGKYPFGNYANEVIEIYKEILKSNYTFPCENSRVESVNSFIKCLLNKKVNERICNVSALKKKPFFERFEFDKLNDFKLKAPFKPSKQNFERYLKEKNPYENYVKEDNSPSNKKKAKDEEIPKDYDPNWADEF
jgi:cGMP-dependent protein kinase